MPTVTRAIEITLPEAVLLADLQEIRFDLDEVLVLCEKITELAAQPRRDYCIEEALVSAAIVRYGRCFTEGVRLSLKQDDLSELDELDAGAHNFFIALRHKFIAHAVNAFEETYVTASARERDGVLLPIESLGAGQHKILLNAGMIPALSRLATSVRNVIWSRIRAEEQILLPVIQALPLEVAHAGNLHTPKHFNPESVGKPRERGVRSNNALKGRRAKRARP